MFSKMVSTRLAKAPSQLHQPESHGLQLSRCELRAQGAQGGDEHLSATSGDAPEGLSAQSAMTLSGSMFRSLFRLIPSCGFSSWKWHQSLVTDVPGMSQHPCTLSHWGCSTQPKEPVTGTPRGFPFCNGSSKEKRPCNRRTLTE